MIISDLNYLENTSEATSIVGGRGRRRNRGGNRRGNSANVSQNSSAVSNIGVGGNVDDSSLTSVAAAVNVSDIDQDNQANDVIAFL